MPAATLKRYPSGWWIAFGSDALRIAGACEEIQGPDRRGVKQSWSKYKDEPIFGFSHDQLEPVLAKCRAAGVAVKLDQKLFVPPKAKQPMFSLE
jgi:hypothetical protein